MKNARRMYSKKMFSDENPTNTVWQLPHTQAAANLAKQKPGTLVRHWCADLEHRTIAPILYTIASRTLAQLYVTPASCHCTIYSAPLHPLHFIFVAPTSFHWTPYT